MDRILNTVEGRDGMRRVLSEVSHRSLEVILELVFQELKSRGIYYGMDGPYPTWDLKWGADAEELLAIRALQKHYTIQPTPNPRSCP